MKNLILFILFLPWSLAFGSLPPQQEATLFQHLHEVNANWSEVSIASIDYNQIVSFDNDIERIQTHLAMVEKVLLSNNSIQNPQREKLINVLATYREAKRFPVNHYHAHRQPYFIDNYGTACAVGHLLQKSGHEDLAETISETMNYAYLNEIPYPEMPLWASEHGFSLDELALIQPGYAPSVNWFNVGTGADDEITAMFADEENGRLIIAGKFTELDGVACNQVGVYENGNFSALGSGIDGTVQAIITFQNNIYLGGDFVGGTNIAIWDGTSWSYELIEPGTVHAFIVHDDWLVAGGDFLGTTSEIRYMAKTQGNGWEKFGYFNGAIYSIVQHQETLYAGGNANPTASFPYFVSVLNENGDWIPSSQPLERLDNIVRDMVSDGTHLYAVGDCFDDDDNPTFGLARLGNSGWERLIDPVVSNLQKHSLQTVQFHKGGILVGGSFVLTPVVGIYGKNLARLNYEPSYTPFLEAIADLDSSVHEIISMDNEVFVGGAFQQNLGSDANYLIKTDQLTSIKNEFSVSIGLSPNPLITSAKGTLPFGFQIREVKLFDLQGRSVSVESQIQRNEFTLFRNQIPNGMYMVRAVSEKGEMAQGKLLIN